MNSSLKIFITFLVIMVAFPTQMIEAQKKTKRIKRPSNRVGISSVDTFVRESFDLYDKVYRFDSYAENGKSLNDDDYEILIDAVEDAQNVLTTAPSAIADLDGAGVLKQGKGTLQINRAKKALKYSIKTSKRLLTEKRKQKQETENNDDVSANDTSSNGNSSNGSNGNNNSGDNSTNSTSEFKVSSKFDFVPGDKLLFFDDFSRDYIGDFPSKWNTNGSGEIVTVNDPSEKWFEMKSGAIYIPDLPQELPDEYTIEFDVAATGLDGKTSSYALLYIVVDDNITFDYGKDYVLAKIPFVQYIAKGISIQNRISNEKTISNSINGDLRKTVLNKPHISIAVNKQRYRLWVNEKKYIDIPRIIRKTTPIKALKFELTGFKDGKDRLFLTNLKVAEGGLDLRRQLIEKGSVSTNGILFDSGSANIQPQSYGIIRQISQVLQQETSMKLNIIGHTDADGNDDTNLELSKKRAAAVKNALITTYNISGDRLQTDGKGESVPVGDNNTTDGKAQNRRVEFIKI